MNILLHYKLITIKPDFWHKITFLPHLPLACAKPITLLTTIKLMYFTISWWQILSNYKLGKLLTIKFNLHKESKMSSQKFYLSSFHFINIVHQWVAFRVTPCSAAQPQPVLTPLNVSVGLFYTVNAIQKNLFYLVLLYFFKPTGSTLVPFHVSDHHRCMGAKSSQNHQSTDKNQDLQMCKHCFLCAVL